MTLRLVGDSERPVPRRRKETVVPKWVQEDLALIAMNNPVAFGVVRGLIQDIAEEFKGPKGHDEPA